MLVDFKTPDANIRVSAGAKAGEVLVTIDRFEQGTIPFVIHLPPTLGRALASTIMGACAEAQVQKKV